MGFLFIFVFIIMKIIITESQHKKLQMRQWLLRRYDLVMRQYKESVGYSNPCKFNNCKDYINRVVVNIMDGLHPEYYLNDNFDYNGLEDGVIDMFYMELTQLCHDKRQECKDKGERY
jgi:hypothetical protein